MIIGPWDLSESTIFWFAVFISIFLIIESILIFRSFIKSLYFDKDEIKQYSRIRYYCSNCNCVLIDSPKCKLCGHKTSKTKINYTWIFRYGIKIFLLLMIPVSFYILILTKHSLLGLVMFLFILMNVIYAIFFHVYSTEILNLSLAAMKIHNTSYFEEIDPSRISKSDYRCRKCGKQLEVELKHEKCPYCGRDSI